MSSKDKKQINHLAAEEYRAEQFHKIAERYMKLHKLEDTADNSNMVSDMIVDCYLRYKANKVIKESLFFKLAELYFEDFDLDMIEIIAHHSGWCDVDVFRLYRDELEIIFPNDLEGDFK